MTEIGAYTTCELCNCPGTLDAAAESGRAPCNVRHFKDELFTVWRCTGCGSLHCVEQVDLPHYYRHYPFKSHKLNFHTRIGYRNRLRLMKRIGFQSSQRILDYGCGSGLFVEFLRTSGVSRAFGYDLFESGYSDQKALAESYDLVVSYDVIEHADDPRQFMHALSRLVRPGGVLVIETPNADHVSLSRPGNPLLHPPYHRHILSRRMLLALGREQDLTVQHIDGRSYFDSLVPTVNSRFIWRYIEKADGLLDSAFEPPRPGLVLRSPDLVFFAFFGYFIPPGDNITVSFRKR
jgi:SAM-dependent methyltransferase